MAGTMDKVMPNLSVGQQPNQEMPKQGDLSQNFGNAATPPMQGGGEQAPQPTPPPSPQPVPGQKSTPSNPISTDQELQSQDADIDQIIGKMKAEMPQSHKEAAAEDHFDKAQKILDSLPGNEGTKTDENVPPTQGFGEAAKFLGAHLRSSLGRNPQEQLNAVQSMYGDDNAKMVGTKLFFRPSAEKPFRMFDQKMVTPLLDWATKNVLSAMHMGGMANLVDQGRDAASKGALNALPGAANAMVTGIGEAGTQVATAMTGGNPAVEAAGTVGSFAAGGAAQAGVQQGLISLTDMMSDKAMRDKRISLSDQAKWGAGVNVAGGLALMGAGKIPVIKSVVSKIQGALGILSPSELAMSEGGAGQTVTDLGKVRSAIDSFHDLIFPKMFVDEEKRGAQTGLNVANAVDVLDKNLGAAVGHVDSVVQGLAKQKDIMPTPTNMMGKLKETLSKYGYSFDRNGYAVDPVTVGDTSAAFGSSNGPGILKIMASFNDASVSTQYSKGGMPMEKLNDLIERFGGLSEYGEEKATQEMGAWRNIRRAASSDRNEFYTKVLDGSGLPEENVWKQVYSDYASKQDALSDFKGMFADRGARELMTEKLLTPGNPKTIDMLDNLEHILGNDSREWNGLRGELVHSLEGRFTKEGVVDAKGLNDFISANKNSPFVSRLFDAEGEKQTYTALIRQATRISTGNALSSKEEDIFKKGVFGLVKVAANHPVDTAGRIISLLGNDQKAIDWLTDRGFLDMVKDSVGKEQRQKILETMSAMSSMRDKMTAVEVPNIVGADGEKKSVWKYLPRAIPQASITGAAQGRQPNIPFLPKPPPQDIQPQESNASSASMVQ